MGTELVPKTLLFGNIRGLIPKTNRCKIDVISDMAYINDSAVIALTESHLSDEINNGEIGIDGYESHRCDRTHKSHGGVIMYTKKCYKTVKVLESAENQCEVLGVIIQDIRTLIICVYRPTKSGNPDTFGKVIDNIQDTINRYANQAQKVILCGDFNFPYIMWPEGSFPGRQSTVDKDKKQAADFLEMMDICGLTNISIIPTRQDNTIDLLMTNDEDNISYKSTVIN